MIMSKTISVSQIKEAAQEAYEQFKDNTGGKNADYIPYLANIDKNLFGISICLLDGRTITLGDSSYCFGIESVSKVHTAILALRQYGAEKVLKMIGADATGLPFNSIMAILLEKLVYPLSDGVCFALPVRNLLMEFIRSILLFCRFQRLFAVRTLFREKNGLVAWQDFLSDGSAVFSWLFYYISRFSLYDIRSERERGGDGVVLYLLFA